MSEDPRDQVVEVDGVRMRRGDTPGFKRVWDEEVTGSVMKYRDGTETVDGVVTKRGPRAIVNEQGHVIGMKPE